MTLLKELSLGLSPRAYTRLMAYIPLILRDNEGKYSVVGLVLELLKAGVLPAQASEKEIDEWLRARFVLSVPEWARIDYERRTEHPCFGMPIVVSCSSRSCANVEVSLEGDGNIDGIPVAGHLVRGAGHRFFCRKCRQKLSENGRHGKWLGFHQAAREVRANAQEEEKSKAREKASEESLTFAKLAAVA